MQKPNILLVSIDTLRSDHVSCYGYHRQTTPNIDRLAAEGIRFTNAYSTAVWTPPAHASMFTGRYPSQHGVVDFKKLNPNIPTLAEVLYNHGYITVGFVNNPAVGAFVGLDKGHTEFFEIWKGVTSRNLFVRGGHFLYRNGLSLLGNQDHGARRTNKLVKNWLKSCGHADKPFYMFLHYIEPHNPIDAPYPYKKKFLRSNLSQNIDMKKLRQVAHNPLTCFTDNLTLNQAEIEYLISLYDGEIAYVDAKVGEVIHFLRDMHILDETLVIITADHGEHFGEHDLFSHVSSLYEPIVHVPLIIRYPKCYKPSQTFEYPVQHIDFLPTILELLQIEDKSLNSLSGKSLLPRNGYFDIDAQRPVLAEWEGRIPEFVKKRYAQSNSSSQMSDLFTKKLTMIRRGNEKYIYGDDGSEELYHLCRDPNELNNLAQIETTRCENLKNALMRTLTVESTSETVLESDMDEIVKQRLQGLGYL